MKIQCLVERIIKRTDGESTFEHRTEKDVEVTLPSDELFADVVQLVLEKLGYPNTESLGAKGMCNFTTSIPAKALQLWLIFMPFLTTSHKR